MTRNLALFGNFVLSGEIEVITGLHIGASADTVEIGGIDSPVVKHPKTGEPYIPGSSIKGKMRSFIEKINAPDASFYNRRIKDLNIHVCDNLQKVRGDKEWDDGALRCPVCRVYGSTGNNGGDNHPARIVVRDCSLSNDQDLKQDELFIFEAKMENAIDRITSAASPRTFERVPAGARFTFEIIYKAQGDTVSENGKTRLSSEEIANFKTDLKNIFEALSLIEKDGLGGSISRGYGQVKFNIDGKTCQFYKVGGGSSPWLPDNSTDIEHLRANSFENIEALFNGAA